MLGKRQREWSLLPGFFLVGGLGLLLTTFAVTDAKAGMDTAWVRHFDGGLGLADSGRAVAVDPSGNVYVAGSSVSPASGEDIAILKYDPDGNLLWSGHFTGADFAADRAIDLTVDLEGNVVVVGESWNDTSGYDIALLKYTPAGVPQWLNVYGLSTYSENRPTALRMDGTGNLYVAGGFGWLYGVSKFAPGGDSLWTATYALGSVVSLPGRLPAFALDQEGNSFIAGSDFEANGSIAMIIKYDSAGDMVWDFWWSPLCPNFFHGLAIGQSGHIYTAGRSGFLCDFATLKLTSIRQIVWVRDYAGGSYRTDGMFFPIDGMFVATDSAENVLSTGYLGRSGSDYDIVTLKHDSAGSLLWDRIYDGPGHGTDAPCGMSVDPAGNAFICGYSQGSGTNYDMTVLLYNSVGDLLREFRYDGAGSDTASTFAEVGRDIVRDAEGSIYVTGYSYGDGTDLDITTIKFNPPCFCDFQSDMDGSGTVDAVDLAMIIDIVFFGGTDRHDDFCAVSRADFNASGLVDAIDLALLVDHVFFGQAGPVDSCTSP